MITGINQSTLYNLQAKTFQSESQIKTDDPEKLKETTIEFEALFVKMMLDSMRKTLNEDGLIPKNSGEKLFEDRLYDEYSKKIANTADIGIARMMYSQLLPDSLA